MFLADITYIKKCNRQTLIKQRNSIEIINKAVNDVLNELCLTNMSTLDGRLDAAKCLLHINKNTPIYVNNDLILAPVYSSRYWEQILVNICLIEALIDLGDKTRIKFYDGTLLDICVPENKIKRLIEKSLKIKEHSFMKEEKINGKEKY